MHDSHTSILRPASPSMERLASFRSSFSQNGQPVRLYRQRVPQQPHERSRIRPGSEPTSWAIAGGEPHVGHVARSQRSSSRHAAKDVTTGARCRAIAVQPR